MNEEMEKPRLLRYFLDKSLTTNDPIEFEYHQRQLLLAIAEHLVEPLQEYEYAERSKLQQEIDESP